MFKLKEEISTFTYLPENSDLPYLENSVQIRIYTDFRFDQEGLYQLTKRSMDLSIALVLLLILSPIIILAALIIRLTSVGPAIFTQKRMTKNGEIFKIYKLRTMHRNFDDKETFLWTQTNDSRITKFGKLLRKTRIDELPQLINVIKGEMSLIGPRPERPELTELLESHFPDFKKRLQVKAGISGLAQVTDGYANDFQTYKNKLDLDLEYINNQGYFLDLKIALKTILVILTCHGSR